MGRTADNILGYTVAFLIIGDGAAWVYLAYGHDIAKTIDDIKKGKVGGGLAHNPIFGNKNPLDEAVRGKLEI